MGKKNRRAIVLGIVSMVLFMIGDWLLDVKGSGNEEIGAFVNSNWPKMSMWRFEVSILLAAVAMPLYWIGLMKLRKIVEDACKRKPQGYALGMNRLFQISSAAGLIAVFFYSYYVLLIANYFQGGLWTGKYI